MDEREVRSLVKGWHQRARRESDPISSFAFLWFCINAWLAFESNEETDRQMIIWLTGPKVVRSELRRSFDQATGPDLFVGYLKTLFSLSPIISNLVGGSR
jgi:hypothetical protein